MLPNSVHLAMYKHVWTMDITKYKYKQLQSQSEANDFSVDYKPSNEAIDCIVI